MPGLAVDQSPGMTIDGVIADQDHGLARRHQGQDDSAELASQPQGGPLGRGEHSLIGGAVPAGQRGSSAEEVGDGASPGGEDGRSEEGDEAGERRLGEDGGQSIEQRSGFGW
jgi:hypothetical protein